jgi:hypothetical protein
MSRSLRHTPRGDIAGLSLAYVRSRSPATANTRSSSGRSRSLPLLYCSAPSAPGVTSAGRLTLPTVGVAPTSTSAGAFGSGLISAMGGGRSMPARALLQACRLC